MNSRGGSVSMVMKRGNQQKPRNVKYVLKRLWDYLAQYKWWLLLALVLTILSNVFSLIGPKLLGNAINAMRMKNGDVQYVDFDLVFHYAALMVIFYVLSAILLYLLRRLIIKISKKIV